MRIPQKISCFPCLCQTSGAVLPSLPLSSAVAQIAGKGEKVAVQLCFMSVSSVDCYPGSWSLFCFFILRGLELLFLGLQLSVSPP